MSKQHPLIPPMPTDRYERIELPDARLITILNRTIRRLTTHPGGVVLWRDKQLDQLVIGGREFSAEKTVLTKHERRRAGLRPVAMLFGHVERPNPSSPHEPAPCDPAPTGSRDQSNDPRETDADPNSSGRDQE